jgi:hypothetical protein
MKEQHGGTFDDSHVCYCADRTIAKRAFNTSCQAAVKGASSDAAINPGNI